MLFFFIQAICSFTLGAATVLYISAITRDMRISVQKRFNLIFILGIPLGTIAAVFASFMGIQLNQFFH